MSNRNDDFTFDDSDDFFKDDSDPFSDFEDDSGVTGGLGDSIAEDLPELDEGPEERGSNSTFIILAIVLVVVFVVGLGVILFLATRPTGPNPIELTSFAVETDNAVVMNFLAQTQTQDVLNIQLTQTALAASPTPSPTFTPSETLTFTPTEPRPTITPTPTMDETLVAAQTALAALTQTASALLQVTPPTSIPPTLPPTVFVDSGGDIRERFATEVAFATLVGIGRQNELSTQQALATQGAVDALQAAVEIQQTIEADRAGAQAAIDDINQRLSDISIERNELALALTQVNLESAMTQAAFDAPLGQLTQAAGATQAAAATLVADLAAQFNDPQLGQPGGIATVIALSTQSAAETQTFFDQQATQGVDIVAPAIEATQNSTATRAALDLQAQVGTLVAIATQNAITGPEQFATVVGVATDAAISTRVALIETALYVSPTPVPSDVVPTNTPLPTTDALAAVNQTATAIAGQFLTATAQVTTPDVTTVPLDVTSQQIPATPTALPDTGIFDDVVGGSGGTGGLLLVVVGLVGVVAVSRVLRSANRRALDETPEEPPQQ